MMDFLGTFFGWLVKECYIIIKQFRVGNLVVHPFYKNYIVFHINNGATYFPFFRCTF